MRSAGTWYRLKAADRGTTIESLSIECFTPPNEEREADATTSRWLKTRAIQSADELEVWLLLGDEEEEVLAYFAAYPDQVRTRADAPPTGSYNLSFAARAVDAGSGAGKSIISYAFTRARACGCDVVSVDPFDDATSAVWQDNHNFKRSQTRAGGGDVEIDDPQAPMRLYRRVPKLKAPAQARPRPENQD